MLRRNARLRREYMYKKSAEANDRATAERKRKVKDALESGKPVPHELRGETDTLREQILLDDAKHVPPEDDIDSEYVSAGVADPKVLMTTSHDPSSKLTQFLKEMKLVVPNCQRMNRGGHTIQQIMETCRADGFTDLIVLQEHRGVPDGLVVSHMPHGPTAYFGLVNVVMRHDIPGCAKMSEQSPHLVLHNLTTRVGQRVGTILKHLFPVPKPDARRVISLVNKSDYISFRHHTYSKDKADINLHEVGPRFELKLYQIKLGTIDQVEVENEWVLRPYMNTARKRQAL
uniref:Brix domain-containing protein n=1 Tax=Coccolithus braarudii TaxID=221442 RepID=A0A7S0LAG2_9EUKA|mmetsp:Transcript_27211/g.58614  ORF Transcript_27211/g.58614 Transcript_27211/m.58614 type:complete len:287 (+) Transcript_27211:92-952(+)